MILKPQKKDFKIIGFYLGKITLALGFLMATPLLIAFFTREVNPVFDFFISFLGCLLIGGALYIFCYSSEEPKWSHGMIVVSLSWLWAAFVAAMPLFLSGHYRSFLDALFEAMSGLTTTGLSLTQDLGHMAYSHNFWRHFTQFLGGQGIVVVMLALFVGGASGAFRLYVGEGREEKLLPDIRQTSRFIWLVSLVYLILGTSVLTVIGFFEGLPPLKSLFHGVCIFMAAFDTGGFTPHPQSVMYYHSLSYEVVTIVIMILGAVNFKLHYALWSGERKEILRNLEIRTLLISVLLLFGLVALGMAKTHPYGGSLALFRKGFYQLISAHTGTGFVTVYTHEFVNVWGSLSAGVLVLAMSLGGSICSTTGAIKMLRIGIVLKAFSVDVRRYISPDSAVFVEKIHHIKSLILTDRHMQATLLITIAYIVVYLGGALVGTFFGYPFFDSLFESTSATANVGLSCGITSVAMPNILKGVYILQMWAGRLEFITVFALIGFLFALVRGK